MAKDDHDRTNGVPIRCGDDHMQDIAGEYSKLDGRGLCTELVVSFPALIAGYCYEIN